MLKEDYESKLSTLDKPFEFEVKNDYGIMRYGEHKLSEITSHHVLYPHRSVIRFNSTYVEMMDSWEWVRGRATALSLPMCIVIILFIFGPFYASFHLVFIEKSHYLIALFCFAGGGLAIFLFSFFYNIGRYDLFGYTHYPIRFNRKTQKVYAFSPKRKKVIELDWQGLRFSAAKVEDAFEIRASKVNRKKIVEEEIILPFRVPDHKVELIDQHLAFFKAYMSGNDLKRVDDSIPEFFDIYNRKETLGETLERTYMADDLNEVIIQTRPKEKALLGISVGAFMWFPQILLRRLGLFFSKIPQWPEHIELECQIDANDPYDSTGKSRHLEPLKFTLIEKLVIFLGWMIGTGFLVGFLVILGFWSWNR